MSYARGGGRFVRSPTDLVALPPYSRSDHNSETSNETPPLAVHAAVWTSSATLMPTSSLESSRNAYGNYSQLRIASEHVGGHGTYSQMRIDSHSDPNYASIWRRTS